MAAEARASALPSAAAKLVAKAYKGRSFKKREELSLEENIEEEAPLGFLQWSKAASWSFWSKVLQKTTTRTASPRTVLFKGILGIITFTDATPCFSSSSHSIVIIKAVIKTLQQYKTGRKKKGGVH